MKLKIADKIKTYLKRQNFVTFLKISFFNIIRSVYSIIETSIHLSKIINAPIHIKFSYCLKNIILMIKFEI